MSDRGSHFKNEAVCELCKAYGVDIHIVPKYSPQVNSLIEGMNKILLEVLKRLCAPDLGEEGWRKIETWEHLLKSWLEHFNHTIFILNN